MALVRSAHPAVPITYRWPAPARLEALAALDALGIGDDWLRRVCWYNGKRLFGL